MFFTRHSLLSSFVKSLGCIAIVSSALASCASAKTDFNEVGKQFAFLIQNAHFSRAEFSDEMSRKFLETYLKSLDPGKIFLTQADVDKLMEAYGKDIDDYILGGQSLDLAEVLYDYFSRQATKRLANAKKIIESSDYKFDSNATVERSRRKVEWAKNQAALDKIWDKMLEEQVLSEILRRETIAKLAKEEGQPDPSLSEMEPKKKIIARYERLLRTVQEVDQEDMLDYLLSAVALTYDPHTDYMGAREQDKFNASMGGALIGIGALLGPEDDGATKVAGIVLGGPVEKDGQIKLNDRIVAVDTMNTGEMTDILFMSIDKVVSLIRGKEGSQVRLKVEPADNPGNPKIITLNRQRVEMKDELVKGEIFDVKNKEGKVTERLGVITLPSFYMDMTGGDRRCATDFKRIMLRMVKEGVKGIVVDLRNNGGGSLEEVRQMSGFFTGSGPVVQIKNMKGGTDVKTVEVAKPLFDGPVVVLINKLSASASEILAAALADYGRAVIVGDTTTFGKGTVQQPVDIGNYLPYFASRDRAGLLKVTIQKFYRVAGGSTQLKGVESDIVLPTASAAFDIGEATMDYALPYDEIAPARNYKKNKNLGKIIPELKKRSEKRVAADKDMQWLKEDIKLTKERIEKNTLSVNKKERIAENEKLMARRKMINAERTVRFAELAKQDANLYDIYRLTLENVDAPSLVKADPKKDNEEYMKMAEDPTAALDKSPEYPSGLDPELRESLNIVADMVDIEASAKNISDK